MGICFILLTLTNSKILLIDVNQINRVYIRGGSSYIVGTMNKVKETPQQIFNKILECKNEKF